MCILLTNHLRRTPELSKRAGSLYSRFLSHNHQQALECSFMRRCFRLIVERFLVCLGIFVLRNVVFVFVNRTNTPIQPSVIVL